MSALPIPVWAVRAMQSILVNQGVTVDEARKQLVPVPVGAPVPDGSGGTRPAMAGEKFPLGAFMSRRSGYNISDRPDTQRMREEKREAFRREMEVQGEQIERAVVVQLKMMVQGVRPALNDVGEAKRDKNGKQIIERIPAAVHVQAIGAAGNLLARLKPQAQRVEMEHSGAVKVEATYAAEVEALMVKLST